MPWWGWVLIVVAIIILIIIFCYIFRKHIPFCDIICDGIEEVGDGIGEIDIDIGGE